MRGLEVKTKDFGPTGRSVRTNRALQRRQRLQCSVPNGSAGFAREPLKEAFKILICLGAMLVADSAFAHHSHAMFDSSKQVTLVGTVKEFDWDNPHCWIQVLVPDPNDPQAAPVEWGVEMNSPLALFRSGWKPGTLKPGDKITVVINPLRDGRPSGQFVSATGPDGKPIGNAPEAPK